MPKYLIDVNLPYHFSLWEGDDYVHVKDIDDQWSDTQIWNYARERDLTIITKDTDFSDRILLVGPPPRVIHIRLGNMRMQAFHQEISRIWDEIVDLSKQYSLVRVFSDHMEGIE